MQLIVLRYKLISLKSYPLMMAVDDETCSKERHMYILVCFVWQLFDF